MRKRDVHAYFKTLDAIAEACGITKSGVWMWPEIIPERHAYRLERQTNGALPLHPEDYTKSARSRRLRAAPARVRLYRAARARKIRSSSVSAAR
jgi:transcriptional repressor of cell division inhibition gene dicB